MRSIKWCFSVCTTFLVLTAAAQAPSFSLKQAVIMVAASVDTPMRQTVQEVLKEEIYKRTGISLPTVNRLPSAGTPVLMLVTQGEQQVAGKTVPRIPQHNGKLQPESFRVLTDRTTAHHLIWVVGADARGLFFGTGWLLRQLRMGSKFLELPASIDFSTAPDYPIRGHQLGYRHTANTYDAWTVAQYEQYIRELAIFGANAVEGIPFQDSENPSPHFKIPYQDMNLRLSEICRKYDMDYWVWTPATFDLKDQEKRQAELDLHEQFYKSCVRLDHIFFPGGDPGHNHPSDVLPFLKDLHSRLIKYHPNGKIWISLQGFDTEQVDYFYRYLVKENPAWLTGVVSGPSSPPIAETRYRLPPKYQHRQYPDITHTVRCEFPVRQWDQAYALTLGREPVNPRPYAMAAIHESVAPFTDGFVSYSDGSHDDVNKIIWNVRGWNRQQDIHEILKEYSRFFFGYQQEDAVANGIAALENNWKGPLAANGGVEATFSFWQALEMKNPSLNKNDWRWQMLLLRAYYDTYTRRRLLFEEASERKINQLMATTTPANWKAVMNAVQSEIQSVDAVSAAPALRRRIGELCTGLFQTIGYQTSVPQYQAKGYERGAVLDFVDYPLNNRWWIQDQLRRVDSINNADMAVQQLQRMAGWENPGAGSYYDDVSSIAKGPRVQTLSDDATDIAWWDNGFSRKRLSSQTYQKCPRLEYNNLNPAGKYIIRVCGYGDALLRVDGRRLEPLNYSREADGFKEWIVPSALTADGKIEVSFDEPEESHLNWRLQSRISDIWLLKQGN